MKTKHRARRLSVRFSPPGDSPRTIDVFHSTASSPPTPPPREVHPIASIPTEPSPFPPIRVRPPESRVSPNADSKSFATKINSTQFHASAEPRERTNDAELPKEIPSKQTEYPSFIRASVRDRIRTHLMTDCPTRRPQSAVRPSVRRRRRPTVPRSRANGTHRVVRAPLLDSDLWKQIYRRFTIRVLDPTPPHPHPIFLSLIWSARACRCRFGWTRVCIFYIGVSQLWDVVLLSCFVNASLDSSFRP